MSVGLDGDGDHGDDGEDGEDSGGLGGGELVEIYLLTDLHAYIEDEER